MKNKRPLAKSDINKSGTWEEVVKENSYFVKYYKAQKIINDEEWDRFVDTLREQLPLAYRFVGDKKKIAVLVSRMMSDYLCKLPETIPRPFPVTWYPGEVSWQHNISRTEIRGNTILKDYHLFLLSEADCGNLVRQELVSQIPPLLLDVKPNHVVLDMCASPGSKTSQLIEMLHKDTLNPTGCIIANDVNNSRCYTMIHNIKRLGSPCLVVTNHNAMTFPNIEVSPNEGGSSVKYLMYDRILCDVPCTGDATLRKNYTIWRRWHSKNGNSLHRLQLSILKRALYLLKPGGRLVYSTCSFNPIENEAVIGAALSFFGTEVLNLVDVSSSLPGLQSEPGLKTWTVFGDENHQFHSYSEFKECTSLPKAIKLQPTLFPSSPDSDNDFHLDRCVRVLPHKQNSGGFFVAVLHKKGHFSSRQQRRGEGSEKLNDKDHPVDEEGKSQNMKVSENVSVASEKEESPVTELEDEETVELDSDALSFENHKPPAKQGRFRGLKEDPFVHITNFESDLCVASLKKDFGVSDTFPFGNLVKRRDTEGGRRVSLTNDICREIVSLNDNSKLKIIHAGTLILEKRQSDESDLSFRVVQDGVNLMVQHLTQRVVQVPSDDVIQILLEESVPFKLLSQPVQDVLNEVSCGSVVLTFEASQVGGAAPDSEPMHSFAFCAWKGRYTIRAYIKECEREHFLRLTGTTLEAVNAARKTKEEIQEKAAEKEKDSVTKDETDVEKHEDN